ncbi:MAG: LUD domain-containing protein [Hyphomicrobium aestuarii]|nr:LUD domain-containing protein [Hyphomicrobium aestuarii]
MSDTRSMNGQSAGPGPGARDRILANVRKALDVPGGRADPREAVVDLRIAERRRHLLPARATLPSADLRAQFASYLIRGKASVIDVADLAGVPLAIAEYLRSQNLPLTLRMGDDPRLRDLPWNTVSAMTVKLGRAEPATDTVTLSYAVAAAAETGTLVLASGPDNPVSLSFLPDTHLVVLEAAMLVGAYEEAFDLVRKTLGDRVMPRTLNFISGPSRTADIGGIPVMGAHGPIHLAVFVIG